MKLSLLYVPCANQEEAAAIANKLLEDKLIACANILPPSIAMFHFNGHLETNEESILLVKTQTDKRAAVAEAVGLMHGYDTPCVLEFKTESMLDNYNTWFDNQF